MSPRHAPSVRDSVVPTRINIWTPAPELDAVRSGDDFLRFGQSGPAVEELQRKLAAAGFPVEVDGKFGAQTQGAIRRFQASMGLQVDGVAGPKTMRALESRFERPPPGIPGIGRPVPNPPGKLPFEDEATQMHGPEFVKKVKEIAAKHGFKPEWLMAVMKNESGLRTDLPNRASGAIGLIQFMPQTATGLGTSTAELGRMTGVQQLDYVDKFFSGIPRGSIKSGADLYLANFYPAAMGKSDDFVLGSEQNAARAREVGAQNRPFDLDRDGRITVREFREYYSQRFPDLR